jgi:peptide/nickel transport system substrate-binding protein
MVKSYHRCIRFEKKPFNSSAFQNAELDQVIAKLTGPLPQAEQTKLWKEYQQILAEEQPRAFLYYYAELEGFSKRANDVRLSLLATLGNMYDWKVGKN